jgi:DNA-binding FadR family transcriptional regulator
MLNVRPGHGTHVSPSTGESSSKPLRWGMFVSWREKLHEFIEARIALDRAWSEWRPTLPLLFESRGGGWVILRG